MVRTDFSEAMGQFQARQARMNALDKAQKTWCVESTLYLAPDPDACGLDARIPNRDLQRNETVFERGQMWPETRKEPRHQARVGFV